MFLDSVQVLVSNEIDGLSSMTSTEEKPKCTSDTAIGEVALMPRRRQNNNLKLNCRLLFITFVPEKI